MASIYFELTGDVTVGVTVTEMPDGSLKFDLDVKEETGTIGDLNGLFFDIGDESLLSGLTISGSDVTDSKIEANSVTKVDSYNSINGEVAKDYGKFDVGVQFGSQGMAENDIQTTSFTLSHDTEALTLDYFLGQDFAVRLTSVGEIDGAREDSSKIGGTADPVAEPAPEPDPVPEPDPDPVPVPDPIHIANDDFFTVNKEEMFGDVDGDVLMNDTTDGNPYLGIATAGNGMPFSDSIVLDGSNGGQLILNADGSTDFSANGDFDLLGPYDSAITTFTYEIEGGSNALIEVQVTGYTGGDGGDGGGSTGGGDFGGGDIPPLDDPFMI